MKKIALLILFVLTSIIECYSQLAKTDYIFTYQKFDDDIFNFIPIKREGVTDEKFNYALRILDETKSATGKDPKKLNVADFWNITSAFVTLKEPVINIEIAFKKAIALDANSVCSYIQMTGSSTLEKIIPEIFLPFYANCLQSAGDKNDKLDAKQYAIDNKLDVKLVVLMDTIDANDRKFRLIKPFDRVKQHPLDLKNRHLIDSLYVVYKTYIGKSLVGKKYESVMWLTIQHSADNAADIKTMEKYLPDISKAVEEKELPVAPLKMLIDRIYDIKYHYQIFGSQVSVPIADEKIRSAVKKKYNIE